jgi:hypothetical protein
LSTFYFDKILASVAASHATPRLALHRTTAARWLTFGDYGASARRYMAIAWSCVIVCTLATVLWIPYSGLSFPSSNWLMLGKGALGLMLAGAFIEVAIIRLRSDSSNIAALLGNALVMAELLYRAILLIAALLSVGVALSYLITAADLPLRDSLLANLDRSLGFDWIAFLSTTNSLPHAASVLHYAYQSTGVVAVFVIVWLSVSRNGERLAEFLALLGLSTVGLCIAMFLIPAAGAFAYYQPAAALFHNYSTLGDMWSFGRTFDMLRDGALSVIDLSALDAIVSFPSFHTILGILTVYALRGTRTLVALVLPLNVTMIAATLPVGGHHLADILASVGLILIAMLVVRGVRVTK